VIAGPLHRRSAERGFTLVEILAVILLTGLVMYAVYSVLFSTLKARRFVDNAVGVYEVGPQIIDLVVEDLNGVAFGLVEENKGLKGGVQNVGGTDVSYLDLVTTRDSRTINPSASIDGELHSDLTEIGYHLVESTNYPGYLELYRREEWGVDDKPLADGLYHKVYDRIKEFTLEYVEAGKEDADSFDDSWDTSDKKRLPRAIKLRVTLVVGDPEQLEKLGETGEHTFERTIVLPAGDDIPEQSGQPGGPGGDGR